MFSGNLVNIPTIYEINQSKYACSIPITVLKNDLKIWLGVSILLNQWVN
jgi:hypothetical protein